MFNYFNMIYIYICININQGRGYCKQKKTSSLLFLMMEVFKLLMILSLSANCLRSSTNSDISQGCRQRWGGGKYLIKQQFCKLPTRITIYHETNQNKASQTYLISDVMLFCKKNILLHYKLIMQTYPLLWRTKFTVTFNEPNVFMLAHVQ